MKSHSSSSPVQRFVFELDIKKLYLRVDYPVKVFFFWISGQNKSRSCDAILLDFQSDEHAINQKLIIHHSFHSENFESNITSLRIVTAKSSGSNGQFRSGERIAECEIDLADLVKDYKKEVLTYKLSSGIDSDASIKLSVNITSFIIDDAIEYSSRCSINSDAFSSGGTVESKDFERHQTHILVS